ncbi:MAG: hypothetical protein ACR2RL_10765 [Gammaproteobacteria bacterium]
MSAFRAFALLGLQTLLVACTAATPARSQFAHESEELRRRVAEFPGQYVWSEKHGRHVLENAIALQEIAAAYDKQVIVDALIGCLDSSASSKITLDDRPVHVGVVCYAALTQHIYYEPTDRNGDVDLEWSGFLEPTARVSELVAAKRAWLSVKKNMRYSWL